MSTLHPTTHAWRALVLVDFMLAGDGDAYSEHEACDWQPIERKPLAGAASLLIAEAA
jgi:hypothetical protein